MLVFGEYSRAYQNFIKEDTACEIFFSDPQGKEYCGRITDIVALMNTDPYCYFSSRGGEENGGQGQAPANFLSPFFSILGERPF